MADSNLIHTPRGAYNALFNPRYSTTWKYAWDKLPNVSLYSYVDFLGALLSDYDLYKGFVRRNSRTQDSVGNIDEAVAERIDLNTGNVMGNLNIFHMVRLFREDIGMYIADVEPTFRRVENRELDSESRKPLLDKMKRNQYELVLGGILTHFHPVKEGELVSDRFHLDGVRFDTLNRETKFSVLFAGLVDSHNYGGIVTPTGLVLLAEPTLDTI